MVGVAKLATSHEGLIGASPVSLQSSTSFKLNSHGGSWYFMGGVRERGFIIEKNTRRETAAMSVTAVIQTETTNDFI